MFLPLKRWDQRLVLEVEYFFVVIVLAKTKEEAEKFVLGTRKLQFRTEKPGARGTLMPSSLVISPATLKCAWEERMERANLLWP